MNHRRLFAVFIVAILAFSVVAPAIVAGQDGNSTATESNTTTTTPTTTTTTTTATPTTTETTTTETAETTTATPTTTTTTTPDAPTIDEVREGQEFTVAELMRDGKHYSVTGARIVPEEQRVYWVESRPVNQPWRDVSREESGQKFGSGELLETNRLYLRTIRAQEDSETVNVTLVYWNKAQRQVRQGNTTTTATVAANVSVTHKSVTLGPGWALGEIELPRHDTKKQVTMWVDDHPTKARWTFEHQSVAFTTPMDINSYGEFTMLGFAFIIAPALGVGWFNGRKVREWIQKAGVPPGHGFSWYLVVITILTGFLMYGAYRWAAELIVTFPVILGVYLGMAYTGYMLATHTGNADRKMFWQPYIRSVDAFAESKIPSVGADNADEATSLSFSEDMPFGQFRVMRVLDEGKEGLSIVQDGWVAFLARLKGGRAKIENADELRTRLSAYNSPWDEVFIIDPKADTLMDYERPGLALRTPDVDDWRDLIWPGAIVGILALTAYQLAQIYGVVAWTAIGVAVPYIIWKLAVVGTDSYVRIDPAPVAMRPVLSTMLTATIGYQDAKDLDAAEEFAWSTLAGEDQSKLEWQRRRDQTYIEETFGQDTPADPTESDAGSNSDGDLSADIDRLEMEKQAAELEHSEGSDDE